MSKKSDNIERLLEKINQCRHPQETLKALTSILNSTIPNK